MIAGVAFRAQPDLTARSAVESLDLHFGSAEFVEHPARTRDQALSGGRQHHLSSQPQKQRRPQLFFRIAQLVAQRGLREVQAFSGFGHAAFFGHGHQQLEVSDFQFRTHIHMSVVH